MRLNRKGQVSFEILLLTIIVLAMAIWVSSYYLGIKDSTLALQLTKVHAIKQIDNSDSLYTIKKISFQETGSNSIDLNIAITQVGANSPDFDCASLDAGELKSNIENNTKYSPSSNVIVRLLTPSNLIPGTPC